jgi:hypothetical protein
MAKGHRGKGLTGQVKQGRATCPVCKRTGIKVVFEVQVKEKTVKVCKTCKAAIGHGKLQTEAEALVVATAAAAPTAGT